MKLTTLDEMNLKIQSFIKDYGLDNDNFPTILFGISSGLLTLVGLITIFISINTQHKIEKARGIIWDLENLHFSPDQSSNQKEKNLAFIKLAYVQYYNLMKTEKLTKNMVSASIITIMLVGFSWFFYSFILFLGSNNLKDYLIIFIFTFLATCILIFIVIILNNLKNTAKAGTLPKHKDLFALHTSSEKNEDLEKMIINRVILNHTTLLLDKNDDNKHIVLIALPLSLDKDLEFEFEISLNKGKNFNTFTFNFFEDHLAFIKFEFKSQTLRIDNKLYSSGKNGDYQDFYFLENSSGENLTAYIQKYNNKNTDFYLLGELKAYKTTKKGEKHYIGTAQYEFIPNDYLPKVSFPSNVKS